MEKEGEEKGNYPSAGISLSPPLLRGVWNIDCLLPLLYSVWCIIAGFSFSLAWGDLRFRSYQRRWRRALLAYCVWGAMLDEFNNLNPKPENTSQLKIVLQTIWDNLPDETILKAKPFAND